MADMEDDIGAVGDKFGQFVAGLVAGAAGANNFASALAKIDAAGIGANLGEQLRVAFDAPLATAEAIGYTLLTGAQMAGNALINGSLTAADLFVKTVGARDYAEGIGLRIRAGLLEAVNAFNKLLASSVKTIILQPFASLPGLIGDPFREALKSVESIQATLDATSRYNYDLWNKGGELINGSIDDALTKVNLITKDWLGVEQSANKVAAAMLRAQDSSAAIRGDVEQPARSAASTPPPFESGEGGGGGGRGGGGGGGSAKKPFDPVTGFGAALRERGSRSVNFDPATSRLSSTGLAIERIKERFTVDKTAANIRADLSRMENRERSAMDRADRFEAAGQFGAAESLRGRSARRIAEREKRLADKYGITLDDQTKTPAERAAEEEAMRDKHGGKGGKSNMEKHIEDIMDAIKKHLPAIDEKLPQTALVYS
jgi:hypothetical protein